MLLLRGIFIGLCLLALNESIYGLPRPGKNKLVIYTPVKYKFIHHHNLEKVPIYIKKHVHYNVNKPIGDEESGPKLYGHLYNPYLNHDSHEVHGNDDDDHDTWKPATTFKVVKHEEGGWLHKGPFKSESHDVAVIGGLLKGAKGIKGGGGGGSGRYRGSSLKGGDVLHEVWSHGTHLKGGSHDHTSHHGPKYKGHDSGDDVWSHGSYHKGPHYEVYEDTGEHDHDHDHDHHDHHDHHHHDYDDDDDTEAGHYSFGNFGDNDAFDYFHDYK